MKVVSRAGLSPTSLPRSAKAAQAGGCGARPPARPDPEKLRLPVAARLEDEAQRPEEDALLPVLPQSARLLGRHASLKNMGSIARSDRTISPDNRTWKPKNRTHRG